jgi:ubiquinone biosynthesis protein UbiJ
VVNDPQSRTIAHEAPVCDRFDQLARSTSTPPEVREVEEGALGAHFDALARRVAYDWQRVLTERLDDVERMTSMAQLVAWKGDAEKRASIAAALRELQTRCAEALTSPPEAVPRELAAQLALRALRVGERAAEALRALGPS